MYKTIIGVLAAALAANTAMADESLRPAILSQGQDTLSEVTVIAHRHADNKTRIPQQVLTLRTVDIERANVQTTADLLSQSGMVAMQRSQQGGGSPMLRGFEANRVLLVVDGIRMNNLIYRSGHLQNIITIDQSMLQSAEVLYGPSSVTYGSDALGGVMAFTTKQPKLALDSTSFRHEVNAFMRYSSVNDEMTTHADVSLGGRRFASLTSITYSEFGNLRSGRNSNPFMHDDEYIHRPYYVYHTDGKDVLVPNDKSYHQPGSGYKQYDIMQKFLYRPNDRFAHTLNFQLSNSSDVPRYDRLTDMKKDKPKFAEWYYGPQFRILTAYNMAANKWLGADKVSMTVAYQRIEESRHNRKLNEAWLGHREEAVDVVTLNTDWMKSLSPTNHLHVGIDGSLNFLSSQAHRVDINTGSEKTLSTRYPDGHNHMHNIDLYAMHTWDITPRLSLSDGARVGYSNMRSTFHSLEYASFLTSGMTKVQQENVTYSFDLGLNYKPSNKWRLALSLSTGYFTPNLDMLTKVFDSKMDNAVVVPNPDVRPEQTIGLDLGVTRLQTGCVLWEATLFGTYLFDAMNLQPFTVNGQTTLPYDGDDCSVYAFQNSKRAYILGANTHLNVKLGAGFAADACATYTYGRIIDGEEKNMPLDHIAPLYGRVGVSYTSPANRFSAEVYSLFNGKKPLSQYNMNGEDNIGYATVKGKDGDGLPAWFTLNLKASYRINSYAIVQLGLENILDTEYRVFGSGINAPGRNLSATIRCRF